MEPISEKILDEVFSELRGFKTIYLSTTDGDRPQVRPVTICAIERKLWVLTGPDSNKMKQIRSNPNFEALLPLAQGENNGYIRFSGEAREIKDQVSKRTAAESAPYFDMYWKGSDDPAYSLLELMIEIVELMKPGDYASKTFSV